jgi:hypothetical protein
MLARLYDIESMGNIPRYEKEFYFEAESKQIEYLQFLIEHGIETSPDSIGEDR